MQDEVAINAESIYKDFVITRDKADSLKSAFVSVLKPKNREVNILHALKNVSFEVKKGEFFGIVGRHGSGKSTLLTILAVIYQPNSGNIKVTGQLVPFIELGVGFNQELTGRENVYLNGAILGFSEKEVGDMYEEIVDFAELGQFMEQKLKNYSSGMQVRLAFSMATRSNADILLIDEVLAVGDTDFQRKCYEYFNKLKRTKVTVVFVSHDMDAIQKYCDRALLIDNSEVVGMGNALNIAEMYIRLFDTGGKENEKDDVEVNRWGDKSLQIKDIQKQVDRGFITVKETIQASKPIDDAILGLRIRTTAGQPITGTNSQFENISVPALKIRDEIEVVWKVPNIFSDGKYYVDLAVTRLNGATVADWWDEAATFTVKKRRALPYSIDPKIELVVNYKHGS